MDDDRQFLYALAAGAAISGLLFWLAFWHGRILLAIAWGITVSVLCLGRYGAWTEWEHLQHHGTPHKIRYFEVKVIVVTLIMIAFSVICEIEGVLPK